MSNKGQIGNKREAMRPAEIQTRRRAEIKQICHFGTHFIDVTTIEFLPPPTIVGNLKLNAVVTTRK